LIPPFDRALNSEPTVADGEEAKAMAQESRVMVAGRYSHEEYALADFAEIKDLYERLARSTALDAAVVSRLWDGRVEVVQTYEPSRREGARRGLGLGLAAGALVAVLPAVGLGVALLGAAGARSAVGAVRGGRGRALGKKELRELGGLLAQGRSGLVVVAAEDLANEVEAALGRAEEVVRRPLRAPTERVGEAS
jgi:hypothetical protein